MIVLYHNFPINREKNLEFLIQSFIINVVEHDIKTRLVTTKPAFIPEKGDFFMHKFSEMKELVSDHLDGHLERLRVEYEDDIHMLMEFAYVGDDDFFMYYDVLVDSEQEQVQFKESFCLYGRNQIRLKQQPRFDRAVTTYLFPKK